MSKKFLKLLNYINRYDEAKVKIALKDHYIGMLGRVSRDDEFTYWESLKTNPYIAFKLFAGDNLHYYNEYGIDAFSQNDYYIFNVGLNRQLAISKYVSLVNFATQEELGSGLISKARIKDILYRLNHPEELEPKAKDVEDPVLNLIINSSKKIKNSPIMESSKHQLYELLSNLGRAYTSELITIKSEVRKLILDTEDPEIALRQKIIEQLNEIDRKINIAITTGELSADFWNFDATLKENLKL